MPDKDHVLAEIITTLGPLPKHWWDRWQLKTDFFWDDRSWKTGTHRCRAPYSQRLAERLRIMWRGEDPATCEFNEEEMKALGELLGRMLAYEPSRRMTTAAGLESDWMKGWGSPQCLERALEVCYVSQIYLINL